MYNVSIMHIANTYYVHGTCILGSMHGLAGGTGEIKIAAKHKSVLICGLFSLFQPGKA